MIKAMRRKARIDAPGALHHVIITGIERRKFFRSDKRGEKIERENQFEFIDEKCIKT